MSGKFLLSLCTLLLAPLTLLAQASVSLPATVDDLVRLGFAKNQELIAARKKIDEAKGLLRQAGVRPSPVLGLRAATGRPLKTEGEEQYAAEITQTLETFGKRAKRQTIAEFDVTQAEAALRDKESSLQYQIRAAYIQRQSELAKLEFLKELQAVNQQSFQLTQARVKEGDVPALEASLLQVELSRTAVLQASAEGRLASSEAELRKLCGLRPQEVLPSGAISKGTLEELPILQQFAMEHRPDLQLSVLAEEQQQAQVALAKANGKPDLDLSLGYTRQDSQFDDLLGQTPTGALAPLRDHDNLLNFGISLPLRTGRSNRGQVQAEIARREGAQLERQYLEHAIPLEVEAAYTRWEKAESGRSLLETGVLVPSKQNLEVIREAYRLGQLRLLDVLNEQRRLTENQLTYIDTQAEAARSWAEVERTIGRNLP